MAPPFGSCAYENVPNSYCLQGRDGAIRAIANSPATPSAWPPRAVLSPIAGLIPATLSRSSGGATIDPDTERPSRRPDRSSPLPLEQLERRQHVGA